MSSPTTYTCDTMPHTSHHPSLISSQCITLTITLPPSHSLSQSFPSHTSPLSLSLLTHILLTLPSLTHFPSHSFVSRIPVLNLALQVEGESEIMEADMVKCRVRLMLTRPLHDAAVASLGAAGGDGAAAVAAAQAALAPGKSVRAFTPNLPLAKDELWHFILADTAANAVLGHTTASLAEAEALVGAGLVCGSMLGSVGVVFDSLMRRSIKPVSLLKHSMSDSGTFLSLIQARL